MDTPKKTVGELLHDLEDCLMALVCDHDLQWGDIFGLIYTYLMVHLPNGREEYEDGSNPEFYYGPRRD